MFPIRDARGRAIGFGGRILGDGEPKSLNSPETVMFHKGRELYGLWEARQALRNIEQLVVVEGYMDVVALARHGIDFAVATLGTATTAEHLNRLFRLTDSVAFCFDGDRAGREAAWRALETALPHIREGRQVRFVFLPDGHDPDTYVNEHGADGFLDALTHGMLLSEFLIDELASQVDLGSVDGKARFAALARPLMAKIPKGNYRDLLLNALAERVDLSVEKLERNMGRPSAGQAQSKGQPPRTALGRRIDIAKKKPSVVRRAITLLLNHPDAGGQLDAGKLANVKRPGIDVLRTLIETVQREPHITTAGLLERWRHDDTGRHLGKLAAVEIPATDDFDPGAELAECLDQLAVAGRRDRIDFLIEKQRLDALSDEERAELRRLA